MSVISDSSSDYGSGSEYRYTVPYHSDESDSGAEDHEPSTAVHDIQLRLLCNMSYQQDTQSSSARAQTALHVSVQAVCDLEENGTHLEKEVYNDLHASLTAVIDSVRETLAGCQEIFDMLVTQAHSLQTQVSKISVHDTGVLIDC